MSSSVCRLRLSGHFSRQLRVAQTSRRLCTLCGIFSQRFSPSERTARRQLSDAPSTSSEPDIVRAPEVSNSHESSSSRLAAPEFKEVEGTYAQATNSHFAPTKKSDIPSVEPYFAEHLEGVFPTLKFPPELARRILTHSSHPAAIYGHNAVYGFLGRRALESYLMLFLHSCPLQPSHDLEDIASRALNSYVLGEHIGSQWGLGRILRWTPTVSRDNLDKVSSNPTVLRSAGLYKVQGDTVAAVIGGVFYQFGAAEAHRVFHTRILPRLFLGRKTEGLSEVFHRKALAISQSMSGEPRIFHLAPHRKCLPPPLVPSHPDARSLAPLDCYELQKGAREEDSSLSISTRRRHSVLVAPSVDLGSSWSSNWNVLPPLYPTYVPDIGCAVKLNGQWWRFLRQSRRYPREEGFAVLIPARGVAEKYAASDTKLISNSFDILWLHRVAGRKLGPMPLREAAGLRYVMMVEARGYTNRGCKNERYQ
ncbi:ribonuclease-III-domain-containing protein [Salix suchowensis]|nr:ribonuclease-III-domain-containing protein [Salix suchowensis]